MTAEKTTTGHPRYRSQTRQDGLKTLPRRPKTAQERPKTAPGPPQDGAQTAPRPPQAPRDRPRTPKSAQDRRGTPRHAQGTLRPRTARPTSDWICPTHRAVPTKRVPIVHQDGLGDGTKSQEDLILCLRRSIDFVPRSCLICAAFLWFADSMINCHVCPQ